MAVYEVKPETGNGRSRVLHRNMLLPCSYLPVETHVKSSTSRRTMSRKTDRQQPLQEKAAWSTHGGVADFTPHQLHEFCGVVQDLVERDVGAKRNLLGLMNRISSGEWWHRWWWLTCQKVTTVEQTTPEDDLWCTRSIILSTEPHSRNSRDHSIISAAVMETCSSTMDTAICSATL